MSAEKTALAILEILATDATGAAERLKALADERARLEAMKAEYERTVADLRAARDEASAAQIALAAERAAWNAQKQREDSDLAERRAATETKEEALRRLRSDLDARDVAQNQRSDELGARERQIEEARSQLARDQARVAEKEADLDKRLAALRVAQAA